MTEGQQAIVFGPFRLDDADGRLLRGETPVALQPRPLAVLRHLAERPGEIVGRDEILATVWAGTYVSKAVLKVAIRAIREALGDDAETPQYVETVGRKGYRFVGGLSADERAAATANAERRRASAPPPEAHGPTMVGRNDARADLREWLRRAIDGSRQIVFLTGEPGIGKTTILEHLLAEIRRTGAAWVARGQCLEQYGEGEPYLPILEALGRLAAEDTTGDVLSVLRRHAPTWIAQLPAFDEPTPTDTDESVAVATPERMLREMADALELLTKKRPLVLALEDLHWSDHSTLDLISYLARRRTPARLLLLGTFRPTDVIVRAHPMHQLKLDLQGSGQCAELPIELLREDEIHAYVAARFPAGASTALQRDLTALLRGRTEGNPLFMVNVVDHLLAAGLLTTDDGTWRLAQSVEDLTDSMPEGVQQLIERHIAALPSDRQQLLEVASVAGAEFVAASVASAVDSDPEEVEDAFEALATQGQFITEAGLVDWPDGTLSGRYQFHHALYRRVLYRRIAEARRVRLHRAIGAREIVAWGARANEHAAELAMHFERGRELERALEYHEIAGQNARRQHATHEAVTHLRRAIALLEELPALPDRPTRELALQTPLAALLMAAETYASPNVREAYERARALCLETSATTEFAQVLRGLSSHHQVRAELTLACARGEEMLQLVESSDDIFTRVQADYGHGTNLFHVGELVGARELLERALAHYDKRQHRDHILVYGGYDPYVGSALWLGWTLGILGFPDQGMAWSQKGIAMAEELGEPFSWAFANYACAISHQVRGEWTEAAALAQRALELARRDGFPQIEANATMHGGWCSVMQGEVEEGARLVKEGADALAAAGALLVRPSHLMMMAVCHATSGERDAAMALIDEGIAEVERTGEQVHAATLRMMKGRLLSGRGARKADIVQATTCLEEALAIAQGQHAATFELRAATSLARLWRGTERADEAKALLGPLVESIAEGHDLPDNRAAKELFDQLNGGDAKTDAKPKKPARRTSRTPASRK